MPGPREQLFFAGTEVESIRPIGPVMEGVGLNITLASYRNCIGFSLHADSTLIPDANAFARFILPAFNELSRLVEDRKQTPSSDTTLETGGISEIAVVD